MVALLFSSILLLQIYSYTCEIAEIQNVPLNTIEESDKRPFSVSNRFKDGFDDYLGDPVASINIDYLNNAVILQFRRSIPVDENDIEEKRRSSIDKNFMRFGKRDQHRMRFGKRDQHRMRFGKRQRESERDQRTLNMGEEELRSERSTADANRNSRGDSFMRLGRQRNDNFMRFGRGTDDNQESRSFMRFGRDPLGFGNELNSKIYLEELAEANPEEPLFRKRRHNSTPQEDQRHLDGFLKLGHSNRLY